MPSLLVTKDDLRTEAEDGSRNYIGLYGALGHLSGHAIQIVTQQSAGKDRFDNYTFGGYWTHYAQSGWCLDGILQGCWYDARGTSFCLPALKTTGNGII